MDDDDELITLWQSYKSDRHVETRNLLFQYYSAWIRKIVSTQFVRYGGQLVEWSDCVQNASIALIGSIEKFDIDRGVPFEAFAYSRIKGSIINGLTHFHRDARIKVSSTDADFLNELRLSESPDEAFDLFIDSVIDIAFSKMLENASYKFHELKNNPLDVYISITEDEKISHTVKLLPPDLQYIINAHYNHYLSFTQIAKEMNLSRSRVSQLHQNALRKIRSLYENS